MEDYVKREKIREKRFGKVRAIIHEDFKGFKLVAVGNQLHYSKNWKTFPDFLKTYMAHVLGKAWGSAELEKPYEERHQILQWYEDMCRFLKDGGTKERDGMYSAIPDGPTAAYLRLSYDLYVLRHHTAMQNEVVWRLKDKGQFQGARHELFVAAAFIRSGFDISYEDETDRTKQHPEFVANHSETRETMSVEAKSRHRPGVLGFPGKREGEKDVKAHVKRLVNRALKKLTPHPYVIFIDLNLPPFPGDISKASWLQEIVHDISEEGGPTEQHPDPYNMLVFTNHPEHYGTPFEPCPNNNTLFVIPKYSSIVLQHPHLLWEIHKAADQYGRIPNWFPER